ncbi:hypothetical protein FRC07_004190 [Ceratobasidium sp. 392]|nr:hypothetical protein FRC07_004190 [Ceratobasidium sp. 392]
MEQLLFKIPGKRLETPGLRWIHATEVKSRKNSMVVFYTAPFEGTTHSDSQAFEEIAVDLQDYISERLNDGGPISLSAFYLHIDNPAQPPTLAAQRNFRTLWHWAKLLNIAKPSICVLSPTNPETPPQDLAHFPALRDMLDLNIWDNNLIHPHPQTMSQFLGIALESSRSGIYVPPAEPLAKVEIAHTFCRVEKEFFGDLQKERIGGAEELGRVGGVLQATENEVQNTKQELENLTIQHNSLLQQLNLRDNTEISDIVQQFRGLNDEIDEFSLEVARTISDEVFKRYPTCEKCHNPTGLREVFGNLDKLPLLLQSSKGVSMETRQFLEFYTGSVVCRLLHGYVFSPFHPFIPSSLEASTQCKAFTQVYNELRLRDPQMLSAKWRVDTYSILRRVTDSRRKDLIQGLGLYIASKIVTVCGHLFGDQVKPEMDDARLIQLVERALKLNDRIKEEVVHAGDIHTECFNYNKSYDDLRMTVLDADEGDALPSHIVSTCGLGVRFTKAVGGGKEPESTFLSKAIVVSEQVYD